jgi:hypothetical protein
MIRPPYAARVAVGIAVTFVEETRKLPATAISLPMTAVSQLLQSTMRLQQRITALAIKGDQVLAWLYPAEEQPQWAVFDEDQVERTPRSEQTAVAASAAAALARQGRFALYSEPVSSSPAEADDNAAAPPAATKAPAVAHRLDYTSLTLAQLRARLKQLSAEELADLLEHEENGPARPPYLTLLSNRIATLSR